MNYGNQIRRLRKLRNLSQSQLADITSLNRGYLSRIENGLQYTSIKTIDKIVNALDCKYDDIFERSADSYVIHVTDLTEDQIKIVNKIIQEFKHQNIQ